MKRRNGVKKRRTTVHYDVNRKRVRKWYPDTPPPRRPRSRRIQNTPRGIFDRKSKLYPCWLVLYTRSTIVLSVVPLLYRYQQEEEVRYLICGQKVRNKNTVPLGDRTVDAKKLGAYPMGGGFCVVYAECNCSWQNFATQGIAIVDVALSLKMKSSNVVCRCTYLSAKYWL